MREKDGRFWDALNEGWLVYGEWTLMLWEEAAIYMV